MAAPCSSLLQAVAGPPPSSRPGVVVAGRRPPRAPSPSSAVAVVGVAVWVASVPPLVVAAASPSPLVVVVVLGLSGELQTMVSAEGPPGSDEGAQGICGSRRSARLHSWGTSAQGAHRQTSAGAHSSASRGPRCTPRRSPPAADTAAACVRRPGPGFRNNLGSSGVVTLPNHILTTSQLQTPTTHSESVWYLLLLLLWPHRGRCVV